MLTGVKGYLVLALDYFEGDPVQNHLGKVGKNYSIPIDFVPGKMIRAKQITPDWLDAVKEQFGEFHHFVANLWSGIKCCQCDRNLTDAVAGCRYA